MIPVEGQDWQVNSCLIYLTGDSTPLTTLESFEEVLQLLHPPKE